MSLSVGLNCPVCGGAIRIEEGIRTTNCPYCTSLLFLEGEGGIQTVMLQNKLTRDAVIQTVQRWFGKGLKARDLKRAGQIGEVYPIYVPFWRMKARAAGWVCGYREETRTHRGPGGRIYTTIERIPMEKMVLRDFEWSRIACDIGDLGIQRLRNLDGDSALHEDGSIPTFEPTKSKTEGQNDGVNSIMQMAVASANVPHITFQKVHVIPKTFGIVYYPIWIARYSYSGRAYFATVDGVTGAVLSGRAPGDAFYRSLIMTGGASCGILGGLGTVFGLMVDSIEIVAVSLLVSLGLMFGAYMFFRHGSEITEGDFPKKKLFDFGFTTYWRG